MTEQIHFSQPMPHAVGEYPCTGPCCVTGVGSHTPQASGCASPVTLTLESGKDDRGHGLGLCSSGPQQTPPLAKTKPPETPVFFFNITTRFKAKGF